MIVSETLKPSIKPEDWTAFLNVPSRVCKCSSFESWLNLTNVKMQVCESGHFIWWRKARCLRSRGKQIKALYPVSTLFFIYPFCRSLCD